MIDERQILQGDCLEVLKTLPDESVDCCVTSPPYYALRDYGTGEWVGGDPKCNHYSGTWGKNTGVGTHKKMQDSGMSLCGTSHLMKCVCTKCGAVRVDKQIGLEETPEEYIRKLTDVFHEVKRVLKKNGTLWLNIGDSYWGSGSRGYDFTGKLTEASKLQSGSQGTINLSNVPKLIGNGEYKNKDLIGIPWMLAFSLRADGWYLRQDIIWHKPNPMPESVKDRCTKSHEYIFLLSKSPQYYFDYEAIQEDSICKDDRRNGQGRIAYDGKRTQGEDKKAQDSFVVVNEKRNKRDVWSVTVKAMREQHFATYPEELVEPCILAGSRLGGVVLDPFFGSGTTGRVAERLGRKWIGIELNEKYIEIAKKRTDNVQIDLFCTN